MPLVAWILSLVGPVAIRALIAIGFTAVSFAGVTTASNALISIAQTAWAGMPLTALQLASLSGIPECLGMVLGAYVARLAVWAAANGSKYIFKGQ